MYVVKSTLEDVPAIANIHLKCWLDTYQFIPKEIHKARSYEHRVTQWSKAVETTTVNRIIKRVQIAA